MKTGYIDNLSFGLLVRYGITWWKALRPFSLVIALNSCLLGIVYAYYLKVFNPINSIIVIICGLFIQAGVNLINDFFEFKQKKIDDKIPDLRIFGPERDLIEWIIFVSGLLCIFFTAPLGLYLVYKTGYPLLILGIIGFIGGYAYTGYPLNYKNKGLGVLFVFFLMGVFMITGSFYAVSGKFDLNLIWVTIPISTLVSFILLCNELRDYEADVKHGIRTLTVRIGYKPALFLYYLLILISYLSTVFLFYYGLFPHLKFIFFSLPFTVYPTILAYRKPEKRMAIIPYIMLHHLAFGILFLLTYIIT
jgi:1,4-dihydroxy-2-naphthoate polyprenyltransferase